MVNNMSIWNKTVKTRKAVELKEDITVDVLMPLILAMELL